MDFKTKAWVVKAKNKHGQKYNYSKTEYIHSEQKVIIICPEHGEFEQRACNHINGRGCPQCGLKNMQIKLVKTTEQFINKANLKHNNFYDYSKTEYIHSEQKIIVICPEHGEFEQRADSHLNGNGCPICAKIKNYCEIEIINFLKEKNIVVENSNRTILNGSELDIFLPEYNIAIEYNGLYWHSDKFKDKNYHLSKTSLTQSKNINLIHIFEDEWIHKKDIVKSRLLNKLNIIDSDKIIYSKNCYIKKLTDKNIIKKFIEKNNIFIYSESNINLGLFYKHNNGKEYLVSIMCFNILLNNDYILTFFNNINYFKIVGSFNKLLKYFEKNYNPKKIIINIDRRWDNFNSFEKYGFIIFDKTEPNYYYINKFNRNIKPLKITDRIIFDSGNYILQKNYG